MAQQLVFTCRHAITSGGSTTDRYTDLIFVDGEPTLVFEWAAREPDRRTNKTVRLNHRLLRVSPDDEPRHSDYTYTEAVNDPR